MELGKNFYQNLDESGALDGTHVEGMYGICPIQLHG